MVFTIEPMVNMGDWRVFVDEEDGWTVVTEDELPSAQWEHTFHSSGLISRLMILDSTFIIYLNYFNVTLE
jgi:hypothetical protein